MSITGTMQYQELNNAKYSINGQDSNINAGLKSTNFSLNVSMK